MARGNLELQDERGNPMTVNTISSIKTLKRDVDTCFINTLRSFESDAASIRKALQPHRGQVDAVLYNGGSSA